MRLIVPGPFTSHSGIQLPWKIDCDALSNEDMEAIAGIIRDEITFSSVFGIPQGGIRLERYLRPWTRAGDRYPPLIVDDVLTTGRSMQHAKTILVGASNAVGVVIFARGPCPAWVKPIFRVEYWFRQ